MRPDTTIKKYTIAPILIYDPKLLTQTHSVASMCYVSTHSYNHNIIMLIILLLVQHMYQIVQKVEAEIK